MKTQLKADLALILITLFWGVSNVLTKIGLGDIAEFNLIALRFVIAFGLAIIVFWKRVRKSDWRTVRYAATIAGILFAVFAFMTFGLRHTTASNAVFLTCLASIFIPIINFIFLKQKPQAKVLVSIVLAMTGVGLLSFQGKFQLNVGDILCVLCSIAFAVHIIVTEKYTQKVDSVSLGVLQLGFVGLYSLVASFVFEIPTLPTTALSWSVVIVLSIFCTAIAFIVQTVAQKYTDSIHTGLIFTLEPVFGAFFAFLFLNEILTAQGYLGGILLIISIVLVEVDFKSLNIPIVTKLFSQKPLQD